MITVMIVLMVVDGLNAAMIAVYGVNAVRSLVTPNSLDSLCWAAFCCTRSMPA